MDNTISPSGDPWFEYLENMAEVLKGIEEYNRGEVIQVSSEELRAFLGV